MEVDSAAGLVNGRGTAIRLRLDNALSPLLDPGFLEAVLRRHFEPLLEPGFNEILGRDYPRGVRFVLNGEALRRSRGASPRRRRSRFVWPASASLPPWAIWRATGAPLPEERRASRSARSAR